MWTSPTQAEAHGLGSVTEGTGEPTELLQGIHSVLHVNPEAQPPQRDLVIGHGERQLGGGAVDDLLGQQRGEDQAWGLNAQVGIWSGCGHARLSDSL